MNAAAEGMLREALAYIDSLSIDDFERELIEAGLNPVRRIEPEYIMESGLVVRKKNVHPEFACNTSFSCNEGKNLDVRDAA